MQIDKLLYNIQIRTDKDQRRKYVKDIDKQTLQRIKLEIIQKVNSIDPDDQNIIEEIYLALQAYQELLQNEYFQQIDFDDGCFVLNLGFYIDNQRNSKALPMALVLIEHQIFQRKVKEYYESPVLFQSLSKIFSFISEQYYQRIVFLMVEIARHNKSLLSQINGCYDFFQCLIQVINKQKEDKIVIYLFGFLMDIYSDKNAKLFHEKDFQILIEIILRVIIDSSNGKSLTLFEEMLIEETLRLYSVLKQNSILTNHAYKFEEIKEALHDKIGFLEPSSLSPSLKLIIDETLQIESEDMRIHE